MNQPRRLAVPAGILLFLSYGPGFAAQTGADAYRVTAIYGRAGDGFTALVQPAEGELLRIRAGDRLGDLEVEEVAERWIQVRPPGAETSTRIWLDGSDPGIPAVSAGSGSPGSGPPGAGGGQERHPAGGPGDAGTGVAGSEPGGQPVVDPAGPGPESGDTEAQGTPLPGERSLGEVAEYLRGTLDEKQSFERPVEDLGAVLGPALGLPTDARIVELQSRPPGSFRDGIRHVLRSAQSGRIVRLTVETGEGRQRVMIFPGQDGEPARVRLMDMGTPATGAGPATPAPQMGEAAPTSDSAK